MSDVASYKGGQREPAWSAGKPRTHQARPPSLDLKNTDHVESVPSSVTTSHGVIGSALPPRTGSSQRSWFGDDATQQERSALLGKLREDTAPRSAHHHHHGHHHHHMSALRPDDPKSATTTFGLIGLVNQMHNADADSNMLLYGDSDDDASALRLQGLSGAFHTPWVSESAAQNLEHNWPHIKCYNVNIQPLDLDPARLTRVGEEALFFAFYTSPRDVRQVHAARELQARNWRFHKGIQRWITKDQDVLVSEDSEKGVFVVFEPSLWRKTHHELAIYLNDLE